MNRALRAGLTLTLLLLFTAAAGANAASPGRRFEAAGRGLSIEFDGLLRSRLVSKAGGARVELGDFAPTEFVVVSGEEVREFEARGIIRRRFRDDVGRGVEYRLRGEAASLAKELSVRFYDDFPTLALVTVSYTNTSRGGLRLDRWAVNRHLPARAGTEGYPFWSYQTGSYESRPDWVMPLEAGFARRNFLGMNSTDYGGGTPVVDVWRRDVGVGVGHVELAPRELSLPVAVTEGGASLGVEGDVGRVLAPGESFATPRTFVSVHRGDYFATLSAYRRFMLRRGIRFPSYGAEPYEPTWCAWGYERNFTAEQIRATLPKARELGLKWATVDDGWQTSEGDWRLDRGKFPRGDEDMLGLTRAVRREGLRPKLWWAPLAADPGTELLKAHPEYLLLDREGKPQKITWWNSYYLCPAYAPVVEDAKALVRRMLLTWGYDGLKLDGQHLNAAPPCYNPAHRHRDPRESVEAAPRFFKAVYGEAKRLKPDSVIELCPCGTAYSFFSLPFLDHAVASDPKNSWQVRTKAKTLKALLGPAAPFHGDHVELSDGGDDFASTVGVGGVVSTKFTLPGLGGPDPKLALTPERERVWRRWLAVYAEKMLSRGEYAGRLYDIGFDRPEAHAVRKGGRMFYAFYADRFDGAVELRGLGPGRYAVRDYVGGKDYGAVGGPVARLRVKFEKYLLLEAAPAGRAARDRRGGE
jgi:alpha-galactosidase